MKFIDKFCEILNEQLSLHEKLLSLSQEKKTILIKGSLPDLERIIKEEHKLIQEVKYLERDRLAMVKQLAEALKISADRITISFLTEVMQDEASKERLQRIKGNLEEVVKELTEVNQLNAKLLEQSLEYIHATMDAITADPEEDLLYSHPVKQGVKKGRSVFDAKT